MRRRLKPFALLIGATLALGAVLASSATASGELFHSDGHHTKLDASAINTQVFVTAAGTIECANVTVHATLTTTTTNQITATPTYSNCGSSLGVTVHIKQRSCDYLFTSETAPHNQVHIECSTLGDHMELNLTFLGSELGCLTIPEQTPTGGGVSYKNIDKGSGTGHIEAEATVTGIEYTEGGVCGSAATNDGTYAGKVTVRGTNTAGAFTEIWWE